MGGIYTVDELHDVLDSGEHDDMIREQEIVVIMLGTNDIRGSKGRRENSDSKVFTDLLEACDRITSRFNTPTAIVQVPPQSSPAHDIEVAVLNTRLETVQTETRIVIHTQDIRKTPKDKTLQKDGFHLTDTAGQKIAEAINTATEDLIKPAELKVHKIETDRDNAKFVIGRKGTRIESLWMKHNVTITTENKKEGNNSYCTIAIKGYKENTDAAAEEIRKILDDANRDLRLRLEEKNREREVCQFFIRGKCIFGNRCRNAHPAGEKRARSTERARPDDRRRPSSSKTHHSSPSPSPSKNAENRKLKAILKKPHQLTSKGNNPEKENPKRKVTFKKVNKKCRTKNHGRKPSKKINIMYANINGAIGKAKSLTTAAQTNNSHVITLPETKITTHPPKITGYSWHTKNRNHNQGGGVAILIRDDLKHTCQQVTDLEDQDQDICWIKMQTNNSAIHIGIYYGKQEQAPEEQIKKEFSKLTTQVNKLKQNGEVILTGDFNAKLEVNKDQAKQKQSRNGKIMAEFLQNTGLQPMSLEAKTGIWTRVNRNNQTEKSVIDYMDPAKNVKTIFTSVTEN